MIDMYTPARQCTTYMRDALASLSSPSLLLHSTVSRTTPLYVSCHRGHMEVIRFLVDSKVDLDSAASNGWTPVHIAARKGRFEVVRLLTSHGADLNKAALDGATALHAAVMNDHFDVAEFLLKNGADPNLAIDTGELPVMIAARRG